MIDRLMDGAGPRYEPGEGSGVIFLHDLAGTPQAFDGLARAMAEAGHTVDVPLLPGHGTELDDLRGMVWDDWASASQLAMDELASRSGPVVVGGIGMGATLACWVAAMHPEVVGLIAINPRAVPVPQEALDMLHAMLADGAEYVPPLAPDVSDRSARIVGYETVPVATLISMFGAINGMAEHWGEIRCPVLVVTSGRDHRVSPYNAEFLGEHVAGPVERLVLERSFHAATVDVEHEELERAAVAFVEKVMAAQPS